MRKHNSYEGIESIAGWGRADESVMIHHNMLACAWILIIVSLRRLDLIEAPPPDSEAIR